MLCVVMSSQDSIGVVLKCMLKGAADFFSEAGEKERTKEPMATCMEEALCMYFSS